MYLLSFCFFLLLSFSFFFLLAINLFSPIRALLFLLGIFLTAAFLLFLIEVEFLSLLLLLVYVGAVFVLFLFCIMMMSSTSLVDLHVGLTKVEKTQVFPFDVNLFFEVLAFSFFLILGWDLGNLIFWDSLLVFEIEDYFWDYSFEVFSLFDFGYIFYTFFFLVFFLLGFVLLFGLLAAMIIVS